MSSNDSITIALTTFIASIAGAILGYLFIGLPLDMFLQTYEIVELAVFLSSAIVGIALVPIFSFRMLVADITRPNEATAVYTALEIMSIPLLMILLIFLSLYSLLAGLLLLIIPAAIAVLVAKHFRRVEKVSA